ncbi:hypothetical protein HanXRQr2_Chr13g0603291 [Helianthus annuus]|uniref:Uncharacterized protein n=1 Tax=Helianthus annuus TaxID=4232 RepID=A0A9K3EK69_HELAN|nr:hypothetical protein HanXRQr2_Chr13g0603291 [Helianthus annuus]KAJ0477971.1 hypothetical protein HanHA300_Chr13g0494891 [Helianthus annuus]KAJ0498822.1 hypothetical protein HanHA89_Chr13g0527291 [Helianthus annuus]KAJ0664841.1 hypothetical protein HanLR1_Chr13g0497351 [Helianthus annuus]KAJ0672281.1 hypothetical protein HanOQP8_Chr13g0495531 [Helianthus annuus]
MLNDDESTPKDKDGMSEPLCSHACGTAFRKFCEDATAVMHKPSSLEMLMWITEGLEKWHLPLDFFTLDLIFFS